MARAFCHLRRDSDVPMSRLTTTVELRGFEPCPSACHACWFRLTASAWVCFPQFIGRIGQPAGIGVIGFAGPPRQGGSAMVIRTTDGTTTVASGEIGP